MLPPLDPVSAPAADYQRFFEQLDARGFRGEIQTDYAHRVVLSTDNSIYQVLPQGVVYPRDTRDVALLGCLLSEPTFQHIVVAPRGGGTGTNGQSLTHGVTVDLSRHMNQILDVNVEEGWVRVQSGVVKDQLNAFLAPYGLFFAPELSTSNRATIGGMINTDASGQGSCVYGKTRDHVLALESVWLGGQVWRSQPLSVAELARVQQRDDAIGQIHRDLADMANTHGALIDERFPKLNRCLTGYDLAHVFNRDGLFDLNSVLCGSEGTLALITEAKLNVLPIPKCVALVNVRYHNFDAALRDAQCLMQAHPTSIETVDETVLGLAQSDYVWSKVEAYFPSDDPNHPCRGVNLMEVVAHSEQALEAQLTSVLAHLAHTAADCPSRLGYTLAKGRAEVNGIWAMRKRAVGLLGGVKGAARPVAFVEDTAVPPENLADFIAEFRALLDRHQLAYGMFGHVDAGVLHVRPALDMQQTVSLSLVRAVTDEVVALTKKYGGLLWGEHGKGVRSEYSPQVFGPVLYACLQRIKGVFDPHNQLNPGKICTPSGADAALWRLDEVPLRGAQDRKIPKPLQATFSDAMNCNGNGACFNYDLDDAMCPSWKGTRQRIHSPKGRAALIRAWLALVGEQGDWRMAPHGATSLRRKLRSTVGRWRGETDFSHQVYEAMSGCLSCKSCVSQCPVKVDVPAFRAQFLEVYHQRYLRPARDHVLANMEFMLPWLSRLPGLYNSALTLTPVRWALARGLGLVDSPLFSDRPVRENLFSCGGDWADLNILHSLPMGERRRSVILVQDAFTSYFESPLVLDVVKFLSRLGHRVWVAPFMANGKPLQVHGFLQRFGKRAAHTAKQLSALAETGIPLVGIEPAMTLTYRQEYVKTLGHEAVPEVHLLQEWLNTQPLEAQLHSDKRYHLLSHCTETTSTPGATKAWQGVFQRLGLELHEVKTGCCGMAGTYGHEQRNLDTSKVIYAQSWQPVVDATKGDDVLLATGYSCRSQVKRLSQKPLSHPVQALVALMGKD